MYETGNNLIFLLIGKTIHIQVKSNFVLGLFLGLDKTLVPRKNPEKLGTDSSKLKTIMCVNSCHCFFQRQDICHYNQ